MAIQKISATIQYFIKFWMINIKNFSSLHSLQLSIAFQTLILNIPDESSLPGILQVVTVVTVPSSSATYTSFVLRS